MVTPNPNEICLLKKALANNEHISGRIINLPHHAFNQFIFFSATKEYFIH